MKTKGKLLAIIGGTKTITKALPHYVWPPITRQVERAVLRQLRKSVSIYNRSGVFAEFEDLFANYHGRKHALLCSSGTLAIHSMFVAAGFQEGDEVICPAYTFFATVSPLLFTGAKPVLCDCDENGNIDPEEIKKKITPRTRGVVVTHMWGVPCQMDRIVDICRKKNPLLLEDCSHAHGARCCDQAVGSFGDLAAWSLQGQKNISGGEGGVLVTDNDEFYYKALLLGHYNKRCKQEIPKDHPLSVYAVTGMGLKYRAHPLAIAIALNMFKNIDRYAVVKDRFAKKVMRKLNTINGLRPPRLVTSARPSWYSLVFQYHRESFDQLPIDKFVEALHAEGLGEVDRPNSTAPLSYLPLFQNPTALFPIYKKYPFSYQIGDFPRAERFYQRAIKIPIWAFRKDEWIVDKYIEGFRKVSDNYKKLL